jgi:hypothetical protein
MGGGGEALTWVLIGFLWAVVMWLGVLRNLVVAFPPSCHPGGPGPAFGGPEFLNFGPMDGLVHGMEMGFPGRPPASKSRMPPAPKWHDDGSSTSHDGGITDDGNCRPSSTFANGKRSNKTHGHAILTCIWSWKQRLMSPRRATEEEKGRSLLVCCDLATNKLEVV